MDASYLLWVLLILTAIGFYLGRSRAGKTVGGKLYQLHSVPGFHGFYVVLWAALPAFLLFFVWMIVEGPVSLELAVSRLPESFTTGDAQAQGLLRADLLNLAAGITTGRVVPPEMLEAAAYYNQLLSIGHWMIFVLGTLMALGGLKYALGQIGPELRARNQVERVVNVALLLCSLVAILTTIGIVMSLLFEAAHFFTQIPVLDFLFGLQWSPQTAIRADQVGSSGAFGAVPLFAGTLLITFIAMIVAVPVGLMSAIYMSEYAPPVVRAVAKPVLEILAGIPTVVYGFFAALTMAPFIRDVFGPAGLGLDVSSESALAAGIVMGVMIIPFVSSLSDDVINAVPQSLRDGAYGLGATKSETIRQIILPAALPGIVGAVMLAISRAIGETMIVTMAAGLNANLTANPFEAVTTVTVQIATLLVGDQEFNSAKTLSAFGLGLVLFLVTLALNMVALGVVQKYREKYD